MLTLKPETAKLKLIGLYPLGLWLFFCLCGLGLIAGEQPLTHEEAKARAARIELQHYDLLLDLSKQNDDQFSGRVQIDFHLNDAAEDLFLDFHGSRITAATLNGKPIVWRTEPGRVVLLANQLYRGDLSLVLAFRADYSSEPKGMRRGNAGTNAQFVTTDLQPFAASMVFPCFDQPDLKAPLTLTAQLPENWLSVANQPLTTRTVAGKNALHTFKTTPPIAPYMFHLTAGDLVRVTGKGSIPSDVYVLQSQAKDLQTNELIDLTQRSLAFYSDLLQRPYPFEKYDHVFLPDVRGGVESPGVTVMSVTRKPKSNLSERTAIAVCHEAAHAWFGGLVTTKWWDDLWLHEGLADYLAEQAVRALYDPSAGDLFTRRRALARRLERSGAGHPLFAEAADSRDISALYSAITYGKGPAALENLAYSIGRDSFRRGLALLLQEHAGGAVTRDDFVQAMTRVAEQDLGSWAQDWGHSQDQSFVSLSRKNRSGQTREIRLTRTNLGPASPRRHTFEIQHFRLEGDRFIAGEQRLIKMDDNKLTLTSWPDVSAQDFFLVDPEGRSHLLVVPSNRELRRFPQIYAGIDPIYRQRLLHIMDDALYLGRINARAYGQILLEMSLSEQDGDLTRRLLNAYSRAAFEVATPKTREQMAENLFRQGLDLRGTKGTPRVVQQHYFGSMLRMALTQEQMDWFYRVYKGGGCCHLPGFSRAQRHDFVQRLIQWEHPAGEMLAPSLLVDLEGTRRMDLQQRYQAAVPKRATKEAAWAQLTNPQLPTADLIQLARAFQHPGDPNITRAYTMGLFDHLPIIYRERGVSHTYFFVRELYPLDDPTIKSIAEAYLAQETNPVLQRFVRERLFLMELRRK